MSLVVSAYTQLRCGISCYHWQVLVSIVWLRNISLMSCFIPLRKYLACHPRECILRMSAAGVHNIMLIVAIFPTGNFSGPDWLIDEFDYSDLYPPTLGYPAKCMYEVSIQRDSPALPPMVFSMFLVSSTFIIQIIIQIIKGQSTFVRRSHDVKVRLYKLSIKHLRNLDEWCEVQHTSNGLRRFLIYHPVLMLFLMTRLSLDTLSSTGQEANFPK
jgi:hypothetical protein